MVVAAGVVEECFGFCGCGCRFEAYDILDKGTPNWEPQAHSSNAVGL